MESYWQKVQKNYLVDEVCAKCKKRIKCFTRETLGDELKHSRPFDVCLKEAGYTWKNGKLVKPKSLKVSRLSENACA